MSEGLILTANFDVGGYVRQLEVFGDSMKPEALDQPLARIGGFVRAQSKRSFLAEGPGWSALAPETIARKARAAAQFNFYARFGKAQKAAADTVAGMGRRLTRALGLAEGGLTPRRRAGALKRASALGEELEGLVEQFGHRLRVKDVAGLIAVAEKELRRRKIHGAAMRAAKLLPKGSAERRRAGRIGSAGYRRSIVSATAMLGDLRNSIHVQVNSGKGVTIYSSVPWSGVHNEGGTAAHGAVQKERRFLKIDEAVMKVAVAIFEAHMLDAFVDDAAVAA